MTLTLQIELLQEEIENKRSRQQQLAAIITADHKHYTLDERFEIWSKYVTKKEEPWVIHASQYPIIGGMVDSCYPCDYDKHKEYSWEFFLEAALDNFEESQDPEFNGSAGYEARFTTQESIDDLKEEMIRLNFGSFEMDW